MPDEVDDELLRRFVYGDPDALQTLFRRFEGEVYHWALRIVRDRGLAEDVVVEAFWRAYRGRARFDSSRSFGAWMRRIATNAACDSLRAARRRSEAPIGSDIPAPGPSQGIAESIEAAFRNLPPKLQVVAALALVEQRSYSEIADALEVPIGTIKSRVSRAVRALRQELERLGIRP